MWTFRKFVCPPMPNGTPAIITSMSPGFDQLIVMGGAHDDAEHFVNRA